MAKYTDKDKTKAWKAFSEYNRRYYCIKTTGTEYRGICITCSRGFVYSALEAGHFVSGRSNAVLFSMKFVRPQCTYCNRIMHGETNKYRKALYLEYGEDYVDRWELKLKSYAKSAKIKNIDWVERTERYKRKLKNIMKPFGLRF